jgi:hypothetical protein
MVAAFNELNDGISSLAPHVERFFSACAEIAGTARGAFPPRETGEAIYPLRSDFNRESSFLLAQLAAAGFSKFGIGNGHEHAWRGSHKQDPRHVLAPKLQASATIRRGLLNYRTEDRSA